MEFALVLPLILVMLFVVAEVAVAARTQLEVSQAAREGAREAAATPDIERAIAAARRALPPGAAGRARVTVQRDHVVGGSAKVVVRLQHRFAAPLFGGFDVSLRAQAVMRVER